MQTEMPVISSNIPNIFLKRDIRNAKDFPSCVDRSIWDVVSLSTQGSHTDEGYLLTTKDSRIKLFAKGYSQRARKPFTDLYIHPDEKDEAKYRIPKSVAYGDLTYVRAEQNLMRQAKGINPHILPAVEIVDDVLTVMPYLDPTRYAELKDGRFYLKEGEGKKEVILTEDDIMRLVIDYIDLARNCFSHNFAIVGSGRFLGGRGRGDVDILWDTSTNMPVFRDFTFIHPLRVQREPTDDELRIWNDIYQLVPGENFENGKSEVRTHLIGIAEQELQSVLFGDIHETIRNIVGIYDEGDPMLTSALQVNTAFTIDDLLVKFQKERSGNPQEAITSLRKGVLGIRGDIQSRGPQAGGSPKDHVDDVIKSRLESARKKRLKNLILGRLGVLFRAGKYSLMHQSPSELLESDDGAFHIEGFTPDEVLDFCTRCSDTEFEHIDASSARLTHILLARFLAGDYLFFSFILPQSRVSNEEYISYRKALLVEKLSLEDQGPIKTLENQQVEELLKGMVAYWRKNVDFNQVGTQTNGNTHKINLFKIVVEDIERLVVSAVH